MTVTETAPITDHEAAQIERANASSATPVVFVHGLWLLPSSWERWVELFERNGFVALTPGWPNDPETVEEAREHPEAVANTSVADVADHLEAVIHRLHRKPVVIGHSFGGLLTEILAGRGLAAVSVAIAPAPFRGVLPLPVSALRAASPALANPANRDKAIPLTYDQFRYAFANAVSADEAQSLYESFAVAAPAKPIFQAASANLNPWTEVKVDTSNPDRGPMLLVYGEHDHTVPHSIVKAAYKKEKRNAGVTEIIGVEGRGHALTIDSGWESVAATALDFVSRFVPGSGSPTGE
jgi:pimeloyl-ACP methyl ester carboxylesterase